MEAVDTPVPSRMPKYLSDLDSWLFDMAMSRPGLGEPISNTRKSIEKLKGREGEVIENMQVFQDVRFVNRNSCSKCSIFHYSGEPNFYIKHIT